jgi:Fur family ferric uptake transcriptional regulator
VTPEHSGVKEAARDAESRAGERSTRQKRALSAVLDGSSSFRSAQDLYADLRARGERVGLTTVYNQLKALADAGEIDVLRADEGESLYRRCSTGGHHHHLLCRRCGKTIEIAADGVESWADRTAVEHGFRDVRHTLEIVGTCGACAGDR